MSKSAKPSWLEAIERGSGSRRKSSKKKSSKARASAIKRVSKKKSRGGSKKGKRSKSSTARASSIKRSKKGKRSKGKRSSDTSGVVKGAQKAMIKEYDKQLQGVVSGVVDLEHQTGEARALATSATATRARLRDQWGRTQQLAGILGKEIPKDVNEAVASGLNVGYSAILPPGYIAPPPGGSGTTPDPTRDLPPGNTNNNTNGNNSDTNQPLVIYQSPTFMQSLATWMEAIASTLTSIGLVIGAYKGLKKVLPRLFQKHPGLEGALEQIADGTAHPTPEQARDLATLVADEGVPIVDNATGQVINESLTTTAVRFVDAVPITHLTQAIPKYERPEGRRRAGTAPVEHVHERERESVRRRQPAVEHREITYRAPPQAAMEKWGGR